MSVTIEWVPMVDVANELSMDYRTFKNNYLTIYPPDRVSGKKKWWRRDTTNRIKKEVLGLNSNDDTSLPKEKTP